tara:strand:- start:20278 stop:20766 length:489 start_codon:yes stop_codon:yes gene_type:complete
MKYIVFEADPIYDSIILAVPHSTKGDKPNEEQHGNMNGGFLLMEAGYGNFEVHKSGGLIFKSLESIRYWLGCKRDLTYVGSSVTCEIEERRNITWLMHSDLKKYMIKINQQMYGGYNLDQYYYNGEIQEGMESVNCVIEYEAYIEMGGELYEFPSKKTKGDK